MARADYTLNETQKVRREYTRHLNELYKYTKNTLLNLMLTCEHEYQAPLDGNPDDQETTCCICGYNNHLNTCEHSPTGLCVFSTESHTCDYCNQSAVILLNG